MPARKKPPLGLARKLRATYTRSPAERPMLWIMVGTASETLDAALALETKRGWLSGEGIRCTRSV